MIIDGLVRVSGSSPYGQGAHAGNDRLGAWNQPQPMGDSISTNTCYGIQLKLLSSLGFRLHSFQQTWPS